MSKGNRTDAFEARHAAEVAADIARERAAVALLRGFVRDNADALCLLVDWGNGAGGFFAQVACEELGRPWPPVAEPSRVPKKAAIPRALAKRVFERDGYRCVTCNGHHDLTCDHIVPESKGGATTFENLQTMCRPCNCRKGTRQ